MVRAAVKINKINIFDLNNKSRIPIQLPDNAKIRSILVSNNHKKAALLNETENGVQLIIADLNNGECNVHSDFLINDIQKRYDALDKIPLSIINWEILFHPDNI